MLAAVFLTVLVRTRPYKQRKKSYRAKQTERTEEQGTKRFFHYFPYPFPQTHVRQK